MVKAFCVILQTLLSVLADLCAVRNEAYSSLHALKRRFACRGKDLSACGKNLNYALAV